jgi:hypothetical protein
VRFDTCASWQYPFQSDPETTGGYAAVLRLRTAVYDRRRAQAVIEIEPGEGRMPSPLEVHDWHELDVYAQDGEHVGKLADVYVSKETGEPEFLLVSSGFLGHKLHMVPADGATRADEKVEVAFDKATIDSAPAVPADDDIDPAEEKRLFEHYGRSYTPHPEGVLILRRFVLVERR